MTSHILVIAEKPSVARSIAGVIGANKKQDGYLGLHDSHETRLCKESCPLR